MTNLRDYHLGNTGFEVRMSLSFAGLGLQIVALSLQCSLKLLSKVKTQVSTDIFPPQTPRQHNLKAGPHQKALMKVAEQARLSVP